MRFALLLLLSVGFAGAASLPDSVVFVGKPKYQRLIDRGASEEWANLPIGERTARVGKALIGTPYVNYTLELHPRIEAPSVNMNGMDCWTFFEISLAAARGLKEHGRPTADQMLRLIELDRYRGGKCDGKFTSRLHHLEDWLQDNAKRGLVKDVTPTLPGARRVTRTMNYMGGSGSRFFKQLRADPSMIPVMRRIESNLSSRGIWYVPKSAVPAAEKHIRDGDIICIVTTWPGSYTSHVGLAVRDAKGTLRFLHASKNARAVTLDSRLSTYLNRYKLHAGIMVARPNDL
ncbi:MAG: DUF1460 domain-containing protein [Terrimicrobiaceae bacterium]|nr:DUF1460 domain-containing protein [Terrimicrobiaceae bacterium]